MPNIRCSNVIVKSLGIVLNNNFALAFTLVLSLDKLFFDIIVAEGFYKGTELFLLVISSGASGVYEDGRADDCCKDFGFLKLTLVNIEDYQQVEVNPLVVIGRG
jgi:hypothetical protein